MIRRLNKLSLTVVALLIACVAILVPAGPAIRFPVTVIGGKLAPAASASLRVQVVEARVHVHPVPEIAVTVKPVGGSATVTVPLVAALPVFETVIV